MEDPMTLARQLPFVALLGLAACDGGGIPSPNLFSLQDDIDLGQQLADEIEADPATYPLLDETTYADAYAHVWDIRDEILSSGEVEHADDFEWQLKIIEDDATLNAVAAPGGFMYVYTGLIKFLDVEDHLAGVLGHEMAHADRRHTTDQLTKVYGTSLLLGIILGEDQELLTEVASALVSLEFSREDEAEADEYSVRYLCETRYAADGAAGFFQKLEAVGSTGVQVPVFLSTHPSDASRIEDIESLAVELGCDTEPWAGADYQSLIDALP
jgi:predicted Zn-dependent protease